MNPPAYLELLLRAAPETILVLAALGVLGVNLLYLEDLELRARAWISALMACLGCLAAIAWIILLPPASPAPDAMLVADQTTRAVKVGLLLFTILTLVLTTESRFTTHLGEYYAVVLFATVGMMLLVGAEDILMIFVSLELTSLALYILAAFDKRDRRAAEATLKYFLFGGMAAAMTLFGFSLIYGLAGSTHLPEIAQRLAEPGGFAGRLPETMLKPDLDPLLMAAIVLTITGFGFKVAAAPFHLWAPDVYEGAPLPSVALIATGSKVAGFVVLAKVAAVGLAGVAGNASLARYAPGWLPLVALLAAGSMVLGNLAALSQSNVRRLLAYSAIAHAGYMLLGVISSDAPGAAGLAPLLYYLLTYGLATLGAFAVVSVVRDRTGGDTLAHFEGLSRRSPILALCLMVFLLSLAGIPPLAGFLGKFYVFSAVLVAAPGEVRLLGLVVLAVATSALSLYYYLQVLKRVYVVETGPASTAVDAVPTATLVVIVGLAGAVVLLGCLPSLVLGVLGSPANPTTHPG
jgi:NADH-quinone oxidoreductase subunit N